MTAIEKAVHAKAIELGKLAIKATTSAGSGHPTTALSLTHLTTVLMYRMMRWDPAHTDARGADRLVLSEGHAVPIIYAACADLGVTITPGGVPRSMTMDDLMALRSIDSPIDGHPNPMLGFPFFDAATGSLGQGLSIAAGLAAAARLAGLDKTIYCIIGDGEAREGQIWEAMDFIADHGLTNVVAIFNCNTLGQSDFVADAQHWQELQRKAKAFNWAAITIDGHDPCQIEDTLRRRSELGGGKPLCVVARTIKGWGVPTLAGLGHHGTPVAPDHLDAALGDLDRKAQELGVYDIDPAIVDDALTIAAPLNAPELPVRSEAIGFEAAVAAEPKVAAALAEKKLMSPRRAFGLALKALGQADPSVVALDADVKNSTYALDFAEAYPERYFEARIAEQNMISVAAGLSSGGMVPFASTFGRFLERAFDQIEMAIVGGANLKLVGTHVGVTLASDGPSQMALADVAFMRSFSHSTDCRGNPAVTVLTPSDGVSAYALVHAMAAFPSACYLRAVRADLPILYEASTEFRFGGHHVLRESQVTDQRVVLVACGYMVHSCLKAAEALAVEGIDVAVVDAYCLPMDTAPVLALAGTGGTVFTVEDTYVGGIGSELAEAAAAKNETPLVKSLAVHVMPKSGRTPDDVLGYVHLAVDDIAAAVQATVAASSSGERASRQPQIKAVLFDIDGTLVDSNDMHVLAWEEAFAQIGEKFDRQVVHDQIGKGTDMLVPTLLPDLDDAAQQQLGDVHGKIFSAKYLDQAKPFPRAHDLLAFARRRGQQVVLASSASARELDHYLGLLDARDLVDVTTSGDDVQRTKPAPDIFSTALKKLCSVDASEAVVVGDTPYDIEAARKCGITAVGLRSGKFSDASLREAGAVEIYDDVASLLANYADSALGR